MRHNPQFASSICRFRYPAVIPLVSLVVGSCRRGLGTVCAIAAWSLIPISAALLLTSPARASDAAAPVALVELFTSQGCYSCPPAEKLLKEEIATRSDTLALELHVDYWDDLLYHGSIWADPFSNRQYTERQTGYNTRIRSTRSVYTPQAVIQGQKQASGTQKDRIVNAIENVLSDPPDIKFRFTGKNYAKAEGALPPGAQLVYAVFWKERITEVNAGENKGKTLTNINVVSQLERLPRGTREIKIPDFDVALQDCAVWVQQGRIGKILSAARCPSV